MLDRQTDKEILYLTTCKHVSLSLAAVRRGIAERIERTKECVFERGKGRQTYSLTDSKHTDKEILYLTACKSVSLSLAAVRRGIAERMERTKVCV